MSANKLTYAARVAPDSSARLMRTCGSHLRASRSKVSVSAPTSLAPDLCRTLTATVVHDAVAGRVAGARAFGRRRGTPQLFIPPPDHRKRSNSIFGHDLRPAQFVPPGRAQVGVAPLRYHVVIP